jgi:hypothetical protein
MEYHARRCKECGSQKLSSLIPTSTITNSSSTAFLNNAAVPAHPLCLHCHHEPRTKSIPKCLAHSHTHTHEHIHTFTRTHTHTHAHTHPPPLLLGSFLYSCCLTAPISPPPFLATASVPKARVEQSMPCASGT